MGAGKYRIYGDFRRGGQPRWSIGEPEDSRMRIPDDLVSTPVFLGGRDAQRIHYGATAFQIAMPTAGNRFGWPVLVTAGHNIDRAMECYGNVWVRLNTDEGGATDVEITEPWIRPDDTSSDIAAIPFPAGLWSESLLIPPDWFVTDQVVAEQGIGVGEDLVIMGLFSSHVGTKRNLPIVRSGIIASNPLEPLQDPTTGGEFNAYLAEVRSIGGMSGSPVFVVLMRPLAGMPSVLRPGQKTKVFFLLGLIRGHWNRDPQADFADDFAESEMGRLNTGIAMVTPITDVLPLLAREEFVTYGRDMDRESAEEKGEQVLDSSMSDSDESEFERFQSLLEKVVQVPKSELDAARKDEGPS
jgi:hypothetical protein